MKLAATSSLHTACVDSRSPNYVSLFPSIIFLYQTARMILRHGASSRAAQGLRQRPLVTHTTRRGLAAPSSGTFAYQSGEAGGVKLASRDLAGPTATLAVIAKAGTRYQPFPGLAEGLEKFAFRV